MIHQPKMRQNERRAGALGATTDRSVSSEHLRLAKSGSASVVAALASASTAVARRLDLMGVVAHEEVMARFLSRLPSVKL